MDLSSAIAQLTRWGALEGQWKAAGLWGGWEQEAFGLPSDIGPYLWDQGQWFLALGPSVWVLAQDLGFRDQGRTLETLWRFWLPLALQLRRERQTLDRPLIQGVLGGQGTGKTTLGKILGLLLPALGLRMVSLSLDDLYLSYGDRQQLRAQDPRLIWRGPPGTHDLALGLETLTQLRQGKPGEKLAIPQFDKSQHQGQGDRIAPIWITPGDIVLFEGWFVGLEPLPDKVFAGALPQPIVTEGDRQFARDNNQRLEAYGPLWQRLDRLLVIYGGDYRWSYDWRREAEEKMKAQGKPGMATTEIQEFVHYFWKALHPELFLPPLLNHGNKVNLAVELGRDRQIMGIFNPQTKPPHRRARG